MGKRTEYVRGDLELCYAHTEFHEKLSVNSKVIMGLGGNEVTCYITYRNKLVVTWVSIPKVT